MEQKQTTFQESGLHPTCETLKYYTYIEVSVTDNFDLVGGEENWSEILQEFSSLIKTEKSNSILECWKKINVAERKMEFVESTLLFFKEWYSEPVALALVEMGFPYIQNLENTEDYRRQLELVDIQVRAQIVFLNQYYQEYSALTKGASLEKRDRMDYQKEMAILRKDGYKINKKTTVFEMAAIINSFLEEHKKN